MMMKVEEVRDAVYAELAPLLSGWKLVKKERAFVRSIQGGTQKIFLSVVDYRPEYRFSPVMATRLNDVEDIYNKFSGARPPADAGTLTSLTQLEYFFPGERAPKQYSVHDAGEIHAAFTELAPVVRDKIVPFLDRHRDVAALDVALNGDDLRIDTSDVTSRSLHALILAHLAGNPRFEELVRRYEAAMSTFPEVSKQRLAKLVEYLRSLRAS